MSGMPSTHGNWNGGAESLVAPDSMIFAPSHPTLVVSKCPQATHGREARSIAAAACVIAAHAETITARARIDLRAA